MERRTNKPYLTSPLPEGPDIAELVRSRAGGRMPAGMLGMDNVRMDAAAEGDRQPEQASLHPVEATDSGLPVELTDDVLLRKCEELLRRYKAGKEAMDARIVENEKWYRQRHGAAGIADGQPAPSSAWLFSALANKHADAMDSMPSLAVLPREESDRDSASTLSDVLPVVLEMNNFEQIYSDMWWYKLRSGTGCFGVFWSNELQNGLGDVAVRSLDLLSLYWEPGITDLQKSQNLFYVTLEDGDVLRQQYPELRADRNGGGRFGGSGIITQAEYVHDENIDKSGKLMMVDWYYKRRNGSRTVLHYCKICDGHVLFCSEREKGYEGGYYEHGKYPFVMDPLFPMPESPAGFGYVDICKGAQLYIDKLDSALLANTILGAKPRFWLKNDGSVNVEEYADSNNSFVRYTGNGNPNESIAQIPCTQMNAYAVTMRDAKIEEMKEVSANRDFSNGGTSGGVTSFAGIQALRESGSKQSRAMIASAYRAFAQVGYLCIDLMRQFYTEARTFRITGKHGETRFTTFSGRSIAAQTVGDGITGPSQRLPVFDIRVVAQKSDPFNSAVQNERAQALYQMGFFRPDMAQQALLTLDMMEFEGIDRVREKISEQAQTQQQTQTLGQLALTMAAQLDEDSGTQQYAPQVQMILQQMGMMQPMGGAPV